LRRSFLFLVNSKDAFTQPILKRDGFLNRFLKHFIRLKWIFACVHGAVEWVIL